jgi:hypothetical protein
MVFQKKEKKDEEEKIEERPVYYKGYLMSWLKTEPDHPDFSLVAEYEAKYGEIK